MLLKSDERWIHHFRMTLQVEPAAAMAPGGQRGDPVTLVGLLEDVEGRVDEGESAYRLNNDTMSMHVDDVRWGPNRDWVALLIGLSDKTVPDAAYRNFETKEIRVLPKAEDEGGAVAAHVLIDLRSVNPGYRVLVESVPGIGKTLLQRFIRHEFREATSYVYSRSDGVESYCWLQPTLEGFMSKRLSDGLREGKLTGFDLVRPAPGGLDDPLIQVERRIVRLRPVGEGMKERAADAIKRVVRFGVQENFESMVVRFTDASGRNRSQEVDISRVARLAADGGAPQVDVDPGIDLEQQQTDIAEAILYVRHDTLDGFDPPLDAAPSSIRDDFLEGMISLMNGAREEG
jgi:hypothetical protein